MASRRFILYTPTPAHNPRVTDPTQCYGVRRLNPIQGVLEVVETPEARALSNDGVRWEIQVLTARPEHSWRSGNRLAPVLRYFRFGTWTGQSGLRQIPVSPIMEIDAMLEASAAMVQALPGCVERLPYPLRDRYELWLLDAGQRPLALLASTIDPDYMTELRPQPWAATALREHRFHSPTLSALGIGEREGGDPRAHAARLERLIRDAGGHPPRCGWLERRPDGGGMALDEDEPGPGGVRQLDAAAFPPLLLREAWDDSADYGLVRDYLAWCAPWLLTLPDLNDATRSRLEQAARTRALAVESRYRLYPRVVHPELIDAARVEARLRRSG